MAQRASQSAVSRTTRAGALLAMGAGLALGVATLAVALGGCASHPPPAQSDGPSMAPAMDELALLADRERRRPVDAARRAPPPPGLATDDFAPVDPADANARRTLAEAVAAFGAAPDADAGPQDAAPVDALRLYASGRAALLSGDLTVAERDLRAAVELDPWSPEARVALAEATLLRGNRIAASAEFAAALERDPMNLRALEFLGREAAQLGDDDRATRLLARAWRLPLAQRDAGLPFLVAADLGEALHRLGWLTAGNESLTVAARIPEPFPSASRHGRDLAALYRERPNFWRDIGDAALRLGDQRTALNAYREASAFPTFDDGSAILLRRVYAAMGAGSPAAAALAIVEDARRVGRFEERHVALTRHVASVQSVRRPLRRAIDEAAAAFTPDVARLNAGLTARTRAAASPDDQALATLRARLALAPADAAAMSDLFDRVGRDNPTGALRETIRLIEASPMNEPRFTRGLFAAQPNLSALGAAWRTVPSSEAGSGAGRLLRARLQATRDPVSAEESLTALLTERPGFTPARVARIETLVQLGRLDEADAELLRIDEGASPETRYAKALALQAMQRYRDALGMLQPLLPPATPLAQADPQHVLRAAELSVAVSEFQSAAAWYTRLAEIDPSREDAYAGLIHLYAANGPLANEAKLTQTLRALRESAPASRTIRRLAAREMAMVGQSDRAARELQDLIGEDPEDREALSLLVGVWLNAGRADLAEPWLRERLAAEPDDGPLVSELARTLAQSGRAQEAESLLRERLSAAPDDLEAARRLEMILRGPLQRASEADALAAARLARAPRTP
ncbi:MAG: tetratricopeptide repeat protein, partial [Phycisphaerales bacterium]|nr:tetratricopeptide repeat protein [Phycisphaerales bacterium]